MEHTTVESYTGWPWIQLLWLLSVFGIPVAAVFVARHRPSWLFRAWLAMWLLLAGGMVAIEPGVLRSGNILIFGFLTGVPSGLTILWLSRTRHHRVLSRAVVQLAGAAVVNLCGFVLAALLTALLHLP